jgi:hypothetical protein
MLTLLLKLVKQVHKSEAQAAAVTAAAAAAVAAHAALALAAAAAVTGPSRGKGSAGGRGKGNGRGNAAGKGGGGKGGTGRASGGRGGAAAPAPASSGAKQTSPFVLPDGAWCKSKTCHLNHDTRRPGETCYRKSDESPELPERIWNSPGHLAALERDRLENHKYFSLPGQPKPMRGPNGTTVPHSPASAHVFDPCIDEYGFSTALVELSASL